MRELGTYFSLSTTNRIPYILMYELLMVLSFFKNGNFSRSPRILYLFQPGDFVHTIGDAHVYVNHIEALKIQV